MAMKMLTGSLKQKLIALAVIVAGGFLVMIVGNLVIDRTMRDELTSIQDRYIPLLESGPKLQAEFEALKRALQDAVASRDRDILAATRKESERLLGKLEVLSPAVDSGKLNALRAVIQDYYTAAYGVSRRLMADETGLAIVTAMKQMQVKQAEAESQLRASTVFDREQLVRAFSEVKRTQTVGGLGQLGVGVVALCVVMIFLLSMGRRIFRSLSTMTEGLRRFGAGDFSEPIPELGQDEIGQVGRDANQMAAKIKTLMDDLKVVNRELEAFSYSVAHDLRAPIRAVQGFSKALEQDHGGVIPEEGMKLLARVIAASVRMAELVDGLLSLSRIARENMVKTEVNLSEMASEVSGHLRESAPDRRVAVEIVPNVVAKGDRRLLRAVLENLLGNAWKFTSKRTEARIEFGRELKAGRAVFYVRDNGAGFDMKHASKLFGTFQRMHSTEAFEGTGIGLATVQRIIHRHGGEIWAEAVPDQGATFFFTLA